MEKNARLYTKGSKPTAQVTNSAQPAKLTESFSEESKEKTPHIPPTDIVEPRSLHIECTTNKYEFPAITSEMEYPLECPRYAAPLNLNLKRDAFIAQPNVHLAFATEMQPESSKIHHFLSYTWKELELRLEYRVVIVSFRTLCTFYMWTDTAAFFLWHFRIRTQLKYNFSNLWSM